MSGADKSEGRVHHAPGYRAIRWHWDWITRPLFALVLGGAAIALLFQGPAFYFMLWVVIGAIPAAREWHRMVGAGRHGFQAAFTGFIIALACFAMVFEHPATESFEVLGAGALLALVIAKLRHMNPWWQAGAIPYLGLPCVALVALRTFPPMQGGAQQAAWIVIGLFIIVWATDIGALTFGNLIGGPRLVPVLSPNKTWAGTIGGSLLATIAFAGFVRFLGGNMLFAAALGAFLSVIAHGGDLFESWVKRHFKVKNSGSLIPGHGGILDRVDSTLSASLVLAILVFAFGVDPLFGGHAPLLGVKL